jgi:hypothetical protein
MESVCKGWILVGGLGKRIFVKRKMLLANKNSTRVFLVWEKAFKAKGYC